MIVELLLGGGLILAGAAAGRLIARRKESGSPHPAAATKPEIRGPRGLRVGDVLLYAETELWLAGHIELDEEGFVLRLFPSPGNPTCTWVAQLDEEGRELAGLNLTEDVPAGVVPEALPIGGRRVVLTRRGRARVSVEGEQLPRTTPEARYAILSDVGGRTLLVIDFEQGARLALVGDRIARHMVELLPGGDLSD